MCGVISSAAKLPRTRRPGSEAANDTFRGAGDTPGTAPQGKWPHLWVGFLTTETDPTIWALRLPRGRAAVVADHEARDIHRFEVVQDDIGEATEVVVVPASVRCADEATAHPIVGEDDSIVSERHDDDGRLRAGGRARRSRYGGL